MTEEVLAPDVVRWGPVGSVPGGTGIYVNGVEMQRCSDFEPTPEQLAMYAEDCRELYGHGETAWPSVDPGELPVASVELARDLDSDSLGAIDEHEVVNRVAGWERVIAWAQAKQSAAIAEIARRRAPLSDDPKTDRGAPCDSSEYVVHELAALLMCSPSSAYQRLATAEALRRLPGTRTAWRDGLLDLARVLMMIEETKALADPDAATVERRCLPKAVGRTMGRFRGIVRRQALAIDATASARREAAARRRRRVGVHRREDGLADLVATLPAEQARLAYLSLCEHARTAAGPDDHRTADERRADAAYHLLTCRPGEPSPVRTDRQGTDSGGRRSEPATDTGAGTACGCPTGTVDGCDRAPSAQLIVTVSAMTLLGLDSDPGELAGYGPISADLARTIARDATWRRIFTRPADGTAVALDQLSYRPGKILGEFVKARDVRCRFPSCARLAFAESIDLDHGIPWPRGKTSATNLSAKCRSHHRLKTHGRWLHEQRPDGTIVWTAPTGHQYLDPLPPVLDPIPHEPDPTSATADDTDDEPPF
ncbi:MAG: DUF222 domain-containing protein [Mycobacteriales bacterium]